MQTDRINLVVLKLVCGLAACLSSASASAQRPAAAGVVRISDRPQSARPLGRSVQPAAMVRGQQMRPTHAMTGNPATDLYRTVRMQMSASRPLPSPRMPRISLENTTGLLSPNGVLLSGGKGHGDCSCGGGCECGAEGACGHGACGCRHGEGERDDNGCCCGRCLSKLCKCDHAFKRRVLGYFACDGCGGQGCPKCGHYNLLYAQNPYYFDRRDGAVNAAQGWGVPMAVPLAPNVRHTYNYGWGIPSSRLTPISSRAPF